MISIAICDDEAFYRKQLLNYIDTFNFDEELKVVEFESGDLLCESYKCRKYFNIILLDVEMPGLNGMDVAKKIRSFDRDVTLIFISSHQNYMSSAFGVKALNYLLKPIEKQCLHQQLLLAIAEYYETHMIYMINNMSKETAIKIRQIQYIEVRNHTVLMFTQAGELCYKGIMEIESKKLLPYGFIRCHRSFLVNPHYIREIDRLQITMQNEEQIPISKNKKLQVMEEYHKFIRRYSI